MKHEARSKKHEAQSRRPTPSAVAAYSISPRGCGAGRIGFGPREETRHKSKRSARTTSGHRTAGTNFDVEISCIGLVPTSLEAPLPLQSSPHVLKLPPVQERKDIEEAAGLGGIRVTTRPKQGRSQTYLSDAI
eukprot:scaffold470_cov257-Pinguiococcus_pyrenoidosus.AAC.3